TENEFAQTQQAAEANKAKSSGGQRSSSSSTGRRTTSSTSKKTGGSSKSSKSSSGRSTKPDSTQDEQPSDEDLKRRKPFTSTLEVGLDQRVEGLVRAGQDRGVPPGIDSKSDFVNQAIKNELDRLEKKHNHGKPFPAPRMMRQGAPPKRSQ
ncbi:hypothetical protein SAMN04487819_1312, partial [Actinopolyspora alba]